MLEKNYVVNRVIARSGPRPKNRRYMQKRHIDGIFERDSDVFSSPKHKADKINTILNKRSCTAFQRQGNCKGPSSHRVKQVPLV